MGASGRGIEVLGVHVVCYERPNYQQTIHQNNSRQETRGGMIGLVVGICVFCVERSPIHDVDHEVVTAVERETTVVAAGQTVS